MSNEKSFSDLSLPDHLLKALDDQGYEKPTPIQAEAIPVLLEKRDLLGQAQTGTGKTAAFALPLLTHIDARQNAPQVLVLTPTRELAIQVAESFRTYARYQKGIHVLPVYGGQGYVAQLKGLKRGVQVVVGTPGRLLDHLERGTLKLDELRALVLDEGDEMLHMGFIEDVETIVSSAPATCQKALFSATLPNPIKRIARKYLREPAEITIASRTTTVESVEQSYLLLKEEQKLEALTRILEVEDFDGVLIFARTKVATVEVAEKLEAKGFPVAALNGDMNQTLRESTINRLKSGRLKMVVATDVAARGLDVDRLSLVINYDIPQDPEPYVHRIGRTGRAGRKGKAILFVTPREKRFLRAIEEATKQRIQLSRIPMSRDLERKRCMLFKERVQMTLENQSLDFFRDYIGELQREMDMSLEELAPILVYLAQKDQPLQVGKTSLDVKPVERNRSKEKREGAKPTRSSETRQPARQQKEKQRKPNQDFKFDRYRVEVGTQHNINTADIVGAIANEVDLDSRYIGRIKLFEEYSTVELPEGMPKATFHHLKKVYIRQRKLNPSLMMA